MLEFVDARMHVRFKSRATASFELILCLVTFYEAFLQETITQTRIFLNKAHRHDIILSLVTETVGETLEI